MCGRYYIDEDMGNEIGHIVREIDENMKIWRQGDVYPSQAAPVIYGRGNHLYGSEMKWGVDSRDRKLLVNARAETAMERPTFSESVRHRRCIIPARHFYEWNSQKQKVTFFRAHKPVIYMAGFYRMQEDVPHFIILTTAANDSMRPVHDRMPLILEETELDSWIWEDSEVSSFLGKLPPSLEHSQEYEQLSLF